MSGAAREPGLRPADFWAVGVFLWCLMVRAEASDQGACQFDVAYTSDVLASVSGGIRHEVNYLDNLDLTLDIDGARAFGLADTNVFIYVLYNNGVTHSADAVGDAQVISNIETGVEAWRLYEMWVDHRFTDQHGVRAGLYDLNSEFDVIEPAGLFLNSAHGIGTDIGQTGANGPSIFPWTSLALRYEFDPEGPWLFRAAVLDAVPGDPDHPARTVIRLDSEEGALVTGEVNLDRDATRLAFGYWRYTESFEILGGGQRQSGNDGWYGFFERSVGNVRGLSMYGRFGQADGDFNLFEYYLGAGIVYQGLITGRDRAGLSVAWAETGDRYRQLNPGHHREVAIELTWRVPINDHLTLQPDVQYVVNPGADAARSNALSVGVRIELSM